MCVPSSCVTETPKESDRESHEDESLWEKTTELPHKVAEALPDTWTAKVKDVLRLSDPRRMLENWGPFYWWARLIAALLITLSIELPIAVAKKSPVMPL